MLQFDEATTRILEDAYHGADVTARRRASFDALAPKNGDHILDLGCGNGLMTLELSRAVGPAGHVTGLDPSADMCSAARSRCQDRENVTLTEGHADAIPASDQSFDKAVSVQVFEYIAPREPSLAELHRTLRSGGRLVIADMHFDTFAWHSDSPTRMRRMMDIWEGHVAEPRIPALLPAELADAGFVVEDLVPHCMTAHHLAPDGMPMMLIRLMHAYAVSNDEMARDEADGWADEQTRLDRDGRFFFSLTHYVCVARRP
ncbi:methyltransferase domain-containing protein [Lutimaribacter marinistellae]|uniref:Methyltransferase domain-containing protein n=1 Tax=Lutimaribacter marinistellae TaxID=1820329 RepID=A0ABV7TL69_9RHOB